jgi:hypothetical protein
MLKQLIQRLLDSRTTPAQAAHSAMPKPETPTIVSDPVTDKTWHSLIAPFDGYFSCKGITKHMLIENSAAQWSGVTGLTSGGYMGFTLPMSKGSEVRYQLDHNSTGVMVTFSKTIVGGGYLRSIVSAVCKRGQLCLSRLSLYLPRSSCRTNPNGLAVKQTSQSQHPGLFSKLPTTPHKSIRRLRTAGLRLGAPNLASTLVSQVRFNLSSLIRKAISEFLPLFEKATQSAFTAIQKTSNRSRQGSFQTKAPHNLLSMGGALC